ncbi:MAG: cobalamin B12-binding domain-containing protein [Planctomycetes bacterium]|nr:cobalamin B12-binding domain-containing protein [Planctomycetota bacterium]
MENPKKIILVNPWIHDFSAYDLWLKPLGLLYIASHLKNHGFKVQLIDCLNYNNIPRPYGCSKFHSEEIAKPCHFQNIPRKYKRYGMPPEVFTQLLMAIDDTSPDDPPTLIGVTSMMTYWHQGASETIKYIKQVFADTPVVLGGVYATLCYEHALKNSGADYVIAGLGEEAMLDIARKLTHPNLTAHQSTDYPAYHLYSNPQSIAMLTSRGCPFNCSYCAAGAESRLNRGASSSLNANFTQRPPDEVVDEIEHYLNHLGVTDIAFYDDALLVNTESHIHPILDGIIRRGLNKKLRFHTPNGLHIRYIDKPLAQKLYQANFKTIRLGFEGMDEPKASPEQLATVIAYLKEAWFTSENIGVYVLMGLPGQGLDKIDRSIEFVHRCGAQVRMAQYSPVPGSADFVKLLTQYPELLAEPLLHNKSVYYCHDHGRRFNEFEALKLKAKELNADITG